MQSTMKTENENKATVKVAGLGETIDTTEAANEFAFKVKAAAPRWKIVRRNYAYEVRPCAKVRGFTLKLPVIGWRLWFPDAQSAVTFADRVGAISYSHALISPRE